MIDGYNGWTNYETWVVNLWMDNEQGSQEFFRETAKDCLATADPATAGLTETEMATIRFAAWLKQHYDENIPAMRGVYGDLLGAALGSVNWGEIARNYIDAVVEELSAD